MDFLANKIAKCYHVAATNTERFSPFEVKGISSQFQRAPV